MTDAKPTADEMIDWLERWMLNEHEMRILRVVDESGEIVALDAVCEGRKPLAGTHDTLRDAIADAMRQETDLAD